MARSVLSVMLITLSLFSRSKLFVPPQMEYFNVQQIV